MSRNLGKTNKTQKTKKPEATKPTFKLPKVKLNLKTPASPHYPPLRSADSDESSSDGVLITPGTDPRRRSESMSRQLIESVEEPARADPVPAPPDAPRGSLVRKELTFRKNAYVKRSVPLPTVEPRVAPPTQNQLIFKDIEKTAKTTLRTLAGPATPQKKLESIRAALNGCYTWFNEQHVHGWDKLDAADKELDAYVRAQLAGLEAKHAELVSQAPATSDGAPMVFADHVSEPDRATARKLWKQIARGEKPLRILGSEAHQNLMKARLVRLLETTTGIRVLDGLLSGDRPVVLTEEGIPDSWLAIVGGSENTGSAAHPMIVPSTRSEVPGWYTAENRDSAANDLMAMSPFRDDKRIYRPVDGPTGISDALAAGDRGIVFTTVDGHQIYRTFGAGAAGTLINLEPSADAHADENGESVHTPSWITLGGLLGAGLRQVRGAVVDDDPDEFATFTLAPDDFKTKWRSADTFVTVTTVENPLSDEVGLRRRGQEEDARDPAVKNRRDAARLGLQDRLKKTSRALLWYRIEIIKRLWEEEKIAGDKDDLAWEQWSAQAEALIRRVDKAREAENRKIS